MYKCISRRLEQRVRYSMAWSTQALKMFWRRSVKSKTEILALGPLFIESRVEIAHVSIYYPRRRRHCRSRLARIENTTQSLQSCFDPSTRRFFAGRLMLLRNFWTLALSLIRRVPSLSISIAIHRVREVFGMRKVQYNYCINHFDPLRLSGRDRNGFQKRPGRST